MARFPIREAEIKALAQNIITGLDGSEDFSAPPVEPDDLKKLLHVFISLGDEQIAAQAAAQQATEAKQDGLDELISAMKTVLRYAEDRVDDNDAKLAALGWSGKAAPTPLQIPGQPRSLAAPRQGAGWLFLDWKRSAEGGSTAFYKIERRELPGGDWILIGTAVESEATLKNQERGKEWEYRIIAANKAGESGPGNTVTAIM